MTEPDTDNRMSGVFSPPTAEPDTAPSPVPQVPEKEPEPLTEEQMERNTILAEYPQLHVAIEDGDNTKPTVVRVAAEKRTDMSVSDLRGLARRLAARRTGPAVTVEVTQNPAPCARTAKGELVVTEDPAAIACYSAEIVVTPIRV